MTTIACSTCVAASRPSAPLDRLLLGVSRRLEALAVARIRRRQENAPLVRAQQVAAERARDLGSAVHHSLLPR